MDFCTTQGTGLNYMLVGTRGNTCWNSVGFCTTKKAGLSVGLRTTWTMYLNYMGLRTTKNSGWAYVDFCCTGFS